MKFKINFVAANSVRHFLHHHIFFHRKIKRHVFHAKYMSFYLLKLLNTIVITRINTEISAIVPPGAQFK
ncbi:hypothetical protein UT300018_23680 [Clostridium faecium]